MIKTYKDIAISPLGTYQLIPDGRLQNAICRWAIIDNRNSTCDIEISWNGSDKKINVIPAGASRLYELPFSWINLKNLSSTDSITSGQVYVQISDERPNIEEK